MTFRGLKCIAMLLCLLLTSGRNTQQWIETAAIAIDASVAGIETAVGAIDAGPTEPEDKTGRQLALDAHSTDPNESDSDDLGDDDGDEGDWVEDGGLTPPLCIAASPYQRIRFHSTEHAYRNPDSDPRTRPPRV